MKILNKTKFLQLPPNTIYSVYSPCIFGHLSVKSETLPNTNDFYSMSLNDCVDYNDTLHLFTTLDNATKTGESCNIDLDNYFRYSETNDNQLYAVWEKQDLLKLKDLIDECLNK